MTTAPAARAARLLLQARHDGVALPAEALGFALEGPGAAYETQALVAAEVGEVGAWKTGAPSPQAEPILAPIFATTVWSSPARLPAARFSRLGIEAEIAYRLARDLPPCGRPYDRATAIAAIDAILPAIEIVDSRLAACEDLDPWWKLADNQINGGLVVGPPLEDWQGIDPPTQPVVLATDGAVVASHDGGNPAGDPLRLLVWLANQVGGHCGGLRAGQIVTTGSLTGLRFVHPGARVVADFAGLGRVEVAFEP